MQTVQVSRNGDRWVFDIPGVGSGVASTMDGLFRTVAERVGAVGQTPAVVYEWADDFVEGALTLQDQRMELGRLELELDVNTRASVVTLSDRGLSVRDIAWLLGISPGRVSQLRSPGQIFGDPDDTTSEIQVVDLHTGKGVVTRFGRGDLPARIEFEGTVYVPTGGAHGANGGPMKYSYIPEAK